MKTAAVIGCGKFGYYHAQKYAAMDGVELACVVDIDRDKAKKVANEFGCQFTDDCKEITNVDLVSIVTPSDTHFEIAKHFIKCGTDVLIEKPMTGSSLLLMTLRLMATQYKVRLWGGFLERYNSIFKEVINERDIEELYTHRSCVYRECRENEDVVFDLMIHDIFLSLSLLCSNSQYTMEVEHSNSLSNCNDFVRAQIKFNNGDKADLTARRDINKKTKMFGVKTKNNPWKLYDLKKKDNDTLDEQLKDFACGGFFDIKLALNSIRMAEEILK